MGVPPRERRNHEPRNHRLPSRERQDRRGVSESDMLGMLQQVGAFRRPAPGRRRARWLKHPDVARFRRALDARRTGSSDPDATSAAELFATGRRLARCCERRRCQRQGSGQRTVDGRCAFGPRVSECSPTARTWSRPSDAVPTARLASDQAIVAHVSDGSVTELWGLPSDRQIVEAARARSAGANIERRTLSGGATRAAAGASFGPATWTRSRRFSTRASRGTWAGAPTWHSRPTARPGRLRGFKASAGDRRHTDGFDVQEVFADDTHAVGVSTAHSRPPRAPGQAHGHSRGEPLPSRRGRQRVRVLGHPRRRGAPG